MTRAASTPRHVATVATALVFLALSLVDWVLSRTPCSTGLMVGVWSLGGPLRSRPPIDRSLCMQRLMLSFSILLDSGHGTLGINNARTSRQVME